MSRTPTRLAIVATHPIQHFVPFYRALSAVPELQAHVLFGSRMGLKPYFDRDMNVEIRWNMDLTSGYEHSFLPDADKVKSSGFLARNNPSIVAALDAFRPTAVVVYGYSNLTALRVILWATVTRTPVLMISDSELLHSRPSGRAILKSILLRLVASRVAGFLTVGDNNEQYWKSYGVGSDRLFRTPFSIDEAVYVSARTRRAELRRDLRAAHGIDESEVVFLAVGKLSARKRQRDLIAALASTLSNARSPIRLVLAGDGSERATLEAMAGAGNLPVTFLGFVNVDELPAVYAAADVLVHASSQDPHPLVCSEAACLGLPMILSDRVGAVGPTDIARSGENALVFPLGDTAALARHMVDLANDSALRSAMGKESLRVFDTQDMRTSVAGVLAAVQIAKGKALG